MVFKPTVVRLVAFCYCIIENETVIGAENVLRYVLLECCKTNPHYDSSFVRGFFDFENPLDTRANKNVRLFRSKYFKIMIAAIRNSVYP